MLNPLLALRTNVLAVPKAWGEELWLTNQPEYCAKLLLLQPDWQCSLHRHRLKKETFIVMEGEVVLQVGVDLQATLHRLTPGEQLTLLPQTYHRFWTTSPQGATILEISTHHSDLDVERLAPSSPIDPF